MSDVAVAQAPPDTDPKQHKLLRIAAWIVGTLLVLVVLHLAGIDVWGWFTQLWDTLSEISIGYIILGCLFQGAQTMLTALGWYGILRYAYPGGVTYMPVLAAYATGVALNNFVPANMGTFVTLLMYVAIVKGSTFPGVLGGYVVQKIFYFVIGTLIYIYLFSAVAGSFDFQFGNERDALTNHPVLVLGIAAGAIFLIAILLRIFWAWVKKMWARAVEGAAILRDLGAYVRLVLLPQIGGYAAKVMVIIVLLKLACTWATPEVMFLRSRRLTRAGSLAMRAYSLTSSCRRSAWPDPCGCGRSSWCADRGPGGPDGGGDPGSCRSRSCDGCRPGPRDGGHPRS